MYYLMSKEYSIKSILPLVSLRYRLKPRQILALQGMSCSEKDIQKRREKELNHTQLLSKTIHIDGFNLVILLESLFSEAYVFQGLDGCYRDISVVRGTYKRVNQTEEVLITLGKTLQELQVEKVVWVFDSPVSNSGMMKTFCYEIAQKYNFNWDVCLEFSPDKFLITENKIVISSDAWILDKCSSWFNLVSFYIDHFYIKTSTIISNTNS